MPDSDSLRDDIVDTAIALGERGGWESVRLHDVADELGIPLEGIHGHFREKEDIAEAWFDRADAAMLREAGKPGFARLATRHRLHRLIMAWLDALSPHRKVTREMIHGKFEPGHPHIQIPGLMRVSRTVQWLREAARRDATFMRRALEETGLTTIYLASFYHWMRDDSLNAENTRRLLDEKLALAERLDHFFYGCRAADAADDSATDSTVAPHPSGNGPPP